MINRTWTIFEKILAVGEIVLAGLTIFFSDYIAERSYPIRQILSDINVFILHLLFLTGGALLFFSKKTGWIISVTMWFLFLIGFNIFTLSNGEINWAALISFSTISIVFLVFMLQKPFLEKYRISKKDWLIIAGMVPVIIIVACWHHLF